MFVLCKQVNVYNFETHYHSRSQIIPNHIPMPSQPLSTKNIYHKGLKLSKHFKHSNSNQHHYNSKINPQIQTNHKRIHSIEYKNKQPLSYQKQIKYKQHHHKSIQTQTTNILFPLKTHIISYQHPTTSTSLQLTNKNISNIKISQNNKFLGQSQPSIKLFNHYRSDKSYRSDHHPKFKELQQLNINISLDKNQHNSGWNPIKHKIHHDLDLKTIVSNENISSKSHVITECDYIIQQSIIHHHNISSNFKQINNKLNDNNYSQYLAYQNNQHIIVCLKLISIDQANKINQQIRNYQQINQHQNILSFYQHLMSDNHHILIKQPYTNRLSEIKKNINIVKLLDDIKCALEYLQSYNKYMGYLEIDDIRQVLGVYKLMHLDKIVPNRIVTIDNNLKKLSELIQKMIL